MGIALDLLAPAKVNLYLRVGERRPDGYHQLVSLFQMVSLYDHIRIRSLKTQDAFRLEGDGGRLPEENTITRAVSLFRGRTGSRRGVSIRVRKGIPLGSGLGGGSSDAAAVLAGLNRLFAGGLDEKELRLLGAELGSDVPFFLSGAAALVRGRGEIVEPVKPRGDYALVLVNPGFPVETRAAYLWLDEMRREAGGAPEPALPEDVSARLVHMYERTEPGSWTLFNSFSPLLTSRYPQLDQVVTALEDAGAVAASISGSGSTIFGLFTDRREARRAARVLKTARVAVSYVEPLEKRPCAGLE